MTKGVALLSQEGSLFLKNYYWITVVPWENTPFLYMACFHGFCLTGIIKLLQHISQETGQHPLDINPEDSQGSQGRVTMLWVFAPCCLIRRRKRDLYRECEASSLALVLVGEFNCHESAGEATQVNTNNPGVSWKTLMTTSWHRQRGIPEGMVRCLTLF